MRKKILVLTVISLFLIPVAQMAMAECEGGRCPMKKGGYQGSEEEYKCPIVSKLMKKAEFYLDNQKELGLSEDQTKQIKSIKMETKKAHIRQMAEMQIFELDLQGKLMEPKVDVEGINAMIDQQLQAMGTSAKATVTNFAKLKAVLTEEQMTKSKELWLANKDR